MQLAIHVGTRARDSWLPALLCLLAGGSLLGLSTNLAKLAGEMGLSPLAYLCWSILGATVILTGLAVLRGIRLPVTARTLEYYGVAALVGVAGPNLVFFSAISHVGAGFVALTITLPPLLTYVGALSLRMERFRAARAGGVVAALAGAGILVAGQLTTAGEQGLWALFTLAGPVLLAVGNIYRTLRWPGDLAPEALAPGMLGAAALLLLGAGVLPGFSLAIPTGSAWPVILIGIQAFVFSGQFLLLFMLQKAGGPVLLSLLGSVGAVVGVPIAIFVQGEAPPAGLFAGACLIAAGIALVILGKMPPKPLHD